MERLRPIIERGGAPARLLMELLDRLGTHGRVLTEQQILYQAKSTRT
jgi:hypothetical protein